MRQRWLQKMRKKLAAKSTKIKQFSRVTASTDSHGIAKKEKKKGCEKHSEITPHQQKMKK